MVSFSNHISKITTVLLWLALATSTFAQTGSMGHRDPNHNKAIAAKKNALLQKKLQTSANKNNEVDPISNNVQLPSDARFAAQFEENQAIVMTWAYNIEFDSSFTVVGMTIMGDSLDGKISCNLADAIQQNALVLIRVMNAEDSITVKQIMENRGTPLYNAAFYVQKIDSWWDRDSGPVCFYFSDQDSIGVLDMDYYTYNAVEFADGTILTDYTEINAFNRINDDSIPVKIAEYFNYPVFRSTINNEGGNLIFDGLGNTWSSTRTRELNTLTEFPYAYDPVTFEFYQDTTIIVYGNYPLLDDAQYEQLFNDSYNTSSFIEPITLDCDGGTGHLDLYLKLIDDNRLGLVDYSHAPNHSDYEDWAANVGVLQTATDGNEQLFDIQVVPMPLSEGDVPQSECEIDQRTYLNGLFVNKSYLMPVQSNPATGLKPSDIEAIEIFKKAMPGYNVIPIDASSMYGYGGAIHCITHEIPAENPIFIRHKALKGVTTLENNYEMTAEIKNKSGIATANAFYRVAGQTEWQSVAMTATSNNNFNFTLPGNGFAALDTIEYFIEATSNNGKTITKPFTAREGGYWKFSLNGFVETAELTDLGKLQITPNPSNGLFQVKGLESSTKQASIRVFNALGQALINRTYTEGMNIDLSTEAAGIYYLQVQVGQEIQSRKLVNLGK